MTGAVKWGGEFLVNTSTADNQQDSAVTGLADGRFVVTWTDYSQTAAPGINIRAQLFNADGSKAGSELLVNTSPTPLNALPAVAALPDGGFVASWNDNGGNGFASAVHSQRFDPAGAKVGGELLADASPSNNGQPAVGAFADGHFVVTWNSGADGDGSAISAQLYNGNGTTAVPAFVVNSTMALGQQKSAVTVLDSSRYLVTWTDYSQSADDATGGAVRGQLFDGGAKVGTEFRINTTTTGDQATPTVAVLHGGSFVVTWTDNSHSADDPSGSAVRGQVFDSTGAKSGGEFLVNTFTDNAQSSPTVAGLSDGRFVVAWNDLSFTDGDNSGFAIHAQVFEADGTKSGAEFLVNTAKFGGQYGPSIAALADGRFIVTWDDHSNTAGDLSESAVRGQILDPREAAINLTGGALPDQFIGTGFNDTMDGADKSDSIDGAGGDDTLSGGAGGDTLNGGDGNDRLDGGNDVDYLNGGDGNDTVIGGAGNDGLNGGAGDDTIAAGGGGGDDLTGGTGDDTYVIEAGFDSLTELANQGIDRVLSAVSHTLQANVENLTLTGTANINGTGNGMDNTIYGSEGNNVIDGMAGNDTMIAAGGADTLIAGAGKDLMTGGGGLDHMVFKSLSDSGIAFAQRDVINTFAHGDKVDVSAIDANSGAAGNQAFTFVDHFTHVAGQLQWDQTAPTGYMIQGDVNGDGAADFSLQIYAAPNFGTIHNWDFIL